MYHVLLGHHRPLLRCLYFGNVACDKFADSLCVNARLARRNLQRHRQLKIMSADK